ncbi:TonB-dependent receptor [uncultured Maribacter sp.]|uniref:SusC/RagA family TonB-linked outer membrane protein n=1 Tax=uncultured Maribacter sp. TaxID=431308 RepID=UPI00260389CA|nr:TonB-dependent receptor [uncultured Maribacter sp.]
MKHIVLLILLVFCTNLIYSQDLKITGNVKDLAYKEPLPGVNVIVKNTVNGTTTDFDGNYILSNVNIGDTIVFSYLGFVTKEVVVKDNLVLNINLNEDVSALEEVVVIGYGTQSKKEVTGAVTVVGSETIQDLNPTQVEQALQGQVAGVNITSNSGSPGSGLSINIRGISSNNVDDSGKSTSRPLILVDGNVIEDLSVINPNDIESINVLKDATAGIYGVRAANGVILIKTKTGRKSTPLKFNYDAYGGYQETSRTIPVLNATEYAVIINESSAANGEPIVYPNLSGLDEGTNWQNQVFQKAPIFSHNLSVNGGTKKSTYSASASLLTQDGIVGGAKANFKRYTTRFNVVHDLFKDFKITASGMYTGTNRRTLSENAIGSVLFNALNNAPTFAVKDTFGAFTLAEGLGNEVINPLAQIEDTFNSNTVNRISGKIGAAYTFLNDFSFESNFQFNYSETQNRTFTPILFYGSGKVFNNIRVNEAGLNTSRLSINKNIFRDNTWDNLLKYQKTLNQKHNIAVLLGMSTFDNSGQFSGDTVGFYDENQDVNLVTANIEDAEDVENGLQLSGASGKYRNTLLSYFTRLQYNYEGKYIFSGVMRRDASSNFGPENKFGYFPSASLGWVVSEEKFLTNNKLINFLKLRGSYGVIGNDRIESNAFQSVLGGEGVYVLNGTRVFGIAASRLANPEVKWEEQKTLDFGIDIKLFNSTVDITADYFKRRTDDLLIETPVSGILGAAAPGNSSPIINAGSMENTGVEFAVGYSPKPVNDFSFGINYNFTFLKNEVTNLPEGVSFVPGGSFGVGQDFPARMEVGKPIGYFFGLQTDGIFQNQAEVDTHAVQANAAPGDLKFVDINNDGVIDTDDRTDIGDPIADVTMGLSLSASYKNFDFSAYTFASIGNDIVRNYERNQALVNKSVYTLNRWTGEGSTNTHPRVTTGATSNTNFSSFYVEDGSFARIQNVQLGYTLSQKTIDRVGIDKLRFYVSVNNLYTFTKYTGYDPSASSGSPIGAGIDQGFYPVPRTYLLGLNLKF